MNLALLLAVTPQTATWSAKVASIMITSNVLCIVSTRYVTQAKNGNNSLSLAGSFATLSLPELLASTSLGHIVGSGIIIGLGYLSLL